MSTKRLCDAKIDKEAGTVTAIVGHTARTIDDTRPIIIDHDREIFGPGAFADGAKVHVSDWAHASIGGGGGGIPRPPVAGGIVRVVDGTAVMTIQYWPDVPRSMDAFRMHVHLKEMMEWSLGFLTLEDGPPTEAQRKLGAQRVLLKVDLVEVSPVARGAQRQTSTVETRADAVQLELHEMHERLRRSIDRHTAMDPAVQRELRAIARRCGMRVA